MRSHQVPTRQPHNTKGASRLPSVLTKRHSGRNDAIAHRLRPDVSGPAPRGPGGPSMTTHGYGRRPVANPRVTRQVKPVCNASIGVRHRSTGRPVRTFFSSSRAFAPLTPALHRRCSAWPASRASSRSFLLAGGFPLVPERAQGVIDRHRRQTPGKCLGACAACNAVRHIDHKT